MIDESNMTFSVVTMGCPKNSVETEFLEGTLQEHGYKNVDLAEARIIIINTCGFIEAAKEESIETVLSLAVYKEIGSCEYLIVTGCLAQRYHKALLREIPEIDGVIGLSHQKELPFYIEQVIKGKKPCIAGSLPSDYIEKRQRNISGNPSAYLQISDGCDNFCAYCAIPMIRGGYRSRSLESLLQEARNLVACGVKEIVLIGQDTAAYGSDIYDAPKTDQLLKELENVDGLEWIRLLYCQPKNLSDQLIETIAESPKVCSYLDIPFQHASKRILKEMKRAGNPDLYLKLVERIRNQIPDVALRTSFIIGFPGESDKDFAELMRFMEDANFDYVGLFEYSPEENTVAANLPDRVPSELIRERIRIISGLRDGLAIERGKSYLGRKVQVLLESDLGGKDESNCYYFQGRTVYQAPDIDGEIEIKVEGDRLGIGHIIQARISQVDVYDFRGEQDVEPS